MIPTISNKKKISQALQINPGSELFGSLSLPSSKSQTMRALLFAAFAKSPSKIYNVLVSNDTKCCFEIIKALGGSIVDGGQYIEVYPINKKNLPKTCSLEVGNSGILLRFITAILIPLGIPFSVTGDSSISSQRTIKPLLDALKESGINVSYKAKEGHAPFQIADYKYIPNKVSVVGRDSQMVSAILLMAAVHQKKMHIQVKDPGELPWVAMTVKWLEKLGFKVHYDQENGSYYEIVHVIDYEGFIYRVPGDLSSLAFPVIGTLLTGGDVKINGVDLLDFQGDRRLFSLLKDAGAILKYDDSVNQLHVKPGPVYNPIKSNINDMIDAVCALTVFCSCSKGDSYITGVENAKFKECNRLSVLEIELKKLGVSISTENDSIKVSKSTIHSAIVNSHLDHRIAMALIILALTIKEGQVIVEDIDCIDKTYPSFINDLKLLGANIELLEC